MLLLNNDKKIMRILSNSTIIDDPE